MFDDKVIKQAVLAVALTGEVDWRHQQTAATKPNVSNIRDEIMVALDRWWFDPAQINVSAHGGTVKLTGLVRSLVERDEAEAAAWASPGTILVENNISVG
jgi:osmotically-inducible protein OsmY